MTTSVVSEFEKTTVDVTPLPNEGVIETYRRAGIVALASGQDVRIADPVVPNRFHFVSSWGLVKFMSDQNYRRVPPQHDEVPATQMNTTPAFDKLVADAGMKPVTRLEWNELRVTPAGHARPDISLEHLAAIRASCESQEAPESPLTDETATHQSAAWPRADRDSSRSLFGRFAARARTFFHVGTQT